jgi:uncharacterized membrane protein YfcA
MISALTLAVVGLGVGALSGMVGVGGGIILVPILVFFFGFEQHLAQGTTTAMLVPPIGILAAYTYYKNGYVDVRAAAWICAGFILGSLFGAKIAVALPKETLRRGFGFLLLAVSARMILSK